MSKAEQILMFYDDGDRPEREPCTYCSADVCTVGLVFALNTRDGGIVCDKCTRERAPEVWAMRNEAFKFADADGEVMRKEGECDAAMEFREIEKAMKLKRDADALGLIRLH